ncbi:penicillin acylase family protein [Parasphingorhabdus sp.]|uniref:penicillin acylase family protein n=1 Tax=Parasphingorhabdus sp. TaxID=2709688 RepID=UPI003264C74F
MKRFFKIFGLLLVLLLGSLAFWLWTPGPQNFDEEAAIEAAKAYDARIIRDKYGVPHIYGKRDADVAFGLAYAQAEDDITNLQEGRSFTRGEMGLATGEEGAITDYLVAAIQARKVANEKYKTDLSSDTRAILEAYSAGINLYCAEMEGRCEPGFAPLTPQDIIAGFVARTPFYYGLDQQLTKLFDGDIELTETAFRARENYMKLDRRIVPGSNGIAVAPSRSTDGHTRLMVNSHQPFLGPAAWYEARLKSEEGWDMIGGMFPGTPFISHGTSPDLGWAITVNKPDLVDFFKLKVNDEKGPTQYMMDGKWLDFEMEEITIRVKLWGPFSFPSKQIIRRSVHGPVFDTPKGFFAASFAGDRNIKAIEQWYKMNKATNKQEWLAAMQIQGIPSFNFVYADKEGNIGYYYNAQVPDRAAGWDWSIAVPGDRSDLVWKGIRPFGSAAPIVSNPSTGYVVNANHTPFESTGDPDKPKRADFPPHYGISDVTTNRGLRAQALYGGDTPISGEEFLRYKMDNRYAEDSRLRIFLRKLAENPNIKDKIEFEKALALFASWDGSTNIDQRAAGLAIRTGQIAKGIQINDEGPEETDPVKALRQAIAEYEQGFDRIDPTWGEVNRLKRGKVDLPLTGGPDVLRAIYSIENPKDGSLAAIAGDSYILYVDWDTNGVANIQTIHQFGSATQDENSPHYADQSMLFSQEKFKTPAMTLEDLLAQASADYRPGKLNQKE